MRPGISPGKRVRLHDYDSTEGTVVMISGRTITVQCDDGNLVALGLGEWFDKTGDGDIERTTLLLPTRSSSDELFVAQRLSGHIIEVNTGFFPEHPPQDRYDPKTTTTGQRVANKIEDFSRLNPNSDHPDAPFASMGLPTLNRYRTKYKNGGVVALLDKRSLRTASPFGDQPDVVIELIREQIDLQKDGATVSLTTFHDRVRRLPKNYNDANETTYQMPSESTLRRLIKQLGKGRYIFGDAKTRRANNASPFGEFVPFGALRPGDEVQIDATKLDILSKDGAGKARRFELSIAVDVASRSIVGHRITEHTGDSLDATHLLSKILTPEPFREGNCR